MNARHVHQQGQPRRSWAPLDPDFPRTLPVFLAPRRTPARTVAHGIRRLVGLGLFAVSVLVAIAAAAVLYAVGV